MVFADSGMAQVVAHARPFHGGIVGLNSFGFGGANVHVLIGGGPAYSGWHPGLPAIPTLLGPATPDALPPVAPRQRAATSADVSGVTSGLAHGPSRAASLQEGTPFSALSAHPLTDIWGDGPDACVTHHTRPTADSAYDSGSDKDPIVHGEGQPPAAHVIPAATPVDPPTGFVARKLILNAVAFARNLQRAEDVTGGSGHVDPPDSATRVSAGGDAPQDVTATATPLLFHASLVQSITEGTEGGSTSSDGRCGTGLGNVTPELGRSPRLSARTPPHENDTRGIYDSVTSGHCTPQPQAKDKGAQAQTAGQEALGSDSWEGSHPSSETDLPVVRRRRTFSDIELDISKVHDL